MKWMRKLLFLLCLGVFSFAATAQGQLNLVLAHGAMAGTPRSDAALWFAETLKTRSNGQIIAEVAGAAKRGDNLELMTAMRSGTLDMSLVTHGTLAMVIPEIAVLGLPYAFSSPEKAWELLDGAVGRELSGKIEQEGMVMLGWMDNGIRHFTTGKRSIQKPEDLKGMRIRSSSDKASLDMMTGFGAVPVPIPFSNVREALRLGFVDGQDNTLANIYFSKLHESQAYLSLTQHCYGFVLFVMSGKSWEKLNAEQRKLIRSVAEETTQKQREMSAKLDAELMTQIQKSSSIKVVKADQQAMKVAAGKIWDSWELKPFGAFVKRVRAAY